MGIYSTHPGITKDEAISIIRNRIASLEQMPDQRIIEILEACVQGRYYNTWDNINNKWVPNPGSDVLIDGGWDDEFAYNNFWHTFKS